MSVVYDLYGGGYANLLGLQVLAARGTCFTCRTSTRFTCSTTAAAIYSACKRLRRAVRSLLPLLVFKFTCFTSTEGQILTPEELQGDGTRLASVC
jgi:hypothetical protein